MAVEGIVGRGVDLIPCIRVSCFFLFILYFFWSGVLVFMYMR